MAERIQRYRVIMEVRLPPYLCVRTLNLYAISNAASSSKWNGNSHPHSTLSRRPKVCHHGHAVHFPPAVPWQLNIVLFPAIAAALQSQNATFMALTVQVAEVHSELEALKAQFKARVGGTRDPFARVS